MRRKVIAMVMACLTLIVIIGGMMIPEKLTIPVKGATPADWNAKSFWFRPWGKSGVHHSIDIFAREGTAVTASSPGKDRAVKDQIRTFRAGSVLSVSCCSWALTVD